MITSSFIILASYVASLILAIFPSSSGFPADVDNAVSFFAGYVAILDPIVPLSTLATVLSLVIAYELAVFGFKGFKWLISHIPAVGGRG